MPLIQFDPAPDMPLLVGALSPGMLRAAGEIADGVVLWMCNPRYVADVVVSAVEEGRRRAGKPLDGFQIVASVPCGPGDDPALMRRTYAKQVLHNLRLPFYRAVLKRGGYTDVLEVLDEVDSYEALARPVSDEALERLGASSFVAEIAAVGSAEDITARLQDYADAGTTIAAINPVRIDDFDATLEAAGAAWTSERTA
jgi:alkanesulfonate monooxygenase SsuD/methylene tetrahydromethanopterin reductase-like flavin-dependent oxidoreductase (luciferase family)